MGVNDDNVPKGRGPLAGIAGRIGRSLSRMNEDMSDVESDESEISLKRRRFLIVAVAGALF